MTDYKMTPEYQKILTEMLGECWINVDYNEQYPLGNKMNCSFTTDSDMMKVFRWLVDNGKWVKFFMWADRKYWKTDSVEGITLVPWLFYDSERFCCLAAQAKKEGVVC